MNKSHSLPLLFILCLLPALTARAQLPLAPDFAFPAKVITDASRVLGSAQGIDRMQAAMQIAAARSAISPDSAFTAPAFISSVAAGEKDTAARGLMCLYEARLLTSLYQADRYRYDRVDAPAEPLPANPQLWSGEQYRSRIAALTDSALTMLRPSFGQRIDLYNKVVKIDDGSRRFFPTLGDFTASVASANMRAADRADAAAAIESGAAARAPEGSFSRAYWLLKHATDRAERLKIYKSWPDAESAGYILYMTADDDSSTGNVALIKAYLAANPHAAFAAPLKSRLAVITRPRATCTAPSYVLPGADFAVAVNHSFTDSVGVNIYRITNPLARYNDRHLTRVGSVVLRTNPDSIAADSLLVTLSRPGEYVLRPTVNGHENTQRWQSIDVIATPYIPFTVSTLKYNWAVLARFDSGAPVAGAAFSLVRDYRPVAIPGKTNADGALRFNMADVVKQTGSYPVIATVDGRTYGFGNNVSVFRPGSYHMHKHIESRTYFDRPVYRPGDSVQWSVTAVLIDPDTKSAALLTDKTGFTVTLSDANGEDIDTLTCATDRYGRMHGAFHIPADRLTGYFSLGVELEEYDFRSSESFMVSDFKAPVFEVTGLKAERADTFATVSGRAVTYSGMPVSDASVAVEVTPLPRWRWFWPYERSARPLTTIVARTDADGYFSAKVDYGTLRPDTDFSAAVTVTSATAETANASVPFTIGKPFSLSAQFATYSMCADSLHTLPVYAIGPDGEKGKLAVTWKLRSAAHSFDGRTDISKEGLNIDWAEIPAGSYKLTVTPTDSALCDSLTVANSLVVYSIARNQVPRCVDWIIPKTEFTSSAPVSVKIGLPAPGYIYAIPYGDEKYGDVKAYALPAGFSDLRLDFLPGCDAVHYQLVTIRNGASSTEVITLRKPDESAITLSAESWRDKLTPGQAEQWNFTLTRADGKPVSGAMIATMYNHSLDALRPYNWAETLPRYIGQSGFSIDCLYAGRGFASFYLPITQSLTDFSLSVPHFRYLPGTSRRIIVRGRSYATGAMRKEALAVETEDAAVDMAAPMPEAVIAENAVMSEESVADAGSSVEPARANETLRPHEVMQAFWMPDISVDSNGAAQLSFIVPLTNTTWAFRALAWDADLATASIIKNIVANKPLMVQPNLPRFLRHGDSAIVSAAVFNNSDSVLCVSAVVEFFDVTTGNALGQGVATTDSVMPGSRIIVSAPVDVPSDASSIGYRIKASSGSFTDGEQTAIPVLTSGATVVDTRNFILSDSVPQFVCDIPAGGDDVVAFQYTANPVWDVVRALPDLLARADAPSAIDAAQMLFGALTAKGMLGSFPQLRTVMDTWAANQADSALVSDLFRNEDLKLALLSQTPWMQAAASQTERMARLTSVFVPANINSTASAAINALRRLQGADGGFRWGSWADQSSPWVTRQVAFVIGHLNMESYLPAGSQTDAIARKALAYCDKHVDADDYSYAFLLSLYPGYKPTTVKATTAVSKAVQHVLNHWRDASTAEKARCALVLHANGYKSVARQIMSSVRQFEVTDSNGAVSFPSVSSVYDYTYILRAFATIMPDTRELDGMRRWLVLQTRANDDLFTLCPAPVITALLSTGSDWLAIPADSASPVTVGGKPLADVSAQYATGAISTRLSAADRGKRLVVRHAQGTPASYGSLTTIGRRPASAVEPASCPDIAVTKRLLVQHGGEWVETDSIALGEKVRVQLLITATNNLEYITVNDERAAAFEPADQLPGYVYASGLPFYRENSDSRTRLFISYLPKGAYYLTYDMTAACAGRFAAGIATVQSQYAPEIVAHSGGSTLTVHP